MSHIFSNLKSNTKLLLTPTSSLSKRELKKKKKVRNRSIGYALILVQAVISFVFMLLLIRLNVIPNKYIAMLISVLVLITAYIITSQFTKSHVLGKCMAILLSVILFVGSVYLDKTSSMLSMISNDKKTSYFSIVVLNSEPAESLGAVKGYPFAYNSTVDADNSQKIITKLNDELNTTLATTAYNDWDSLINGLYNQNIKAIIINEDYRSDIEKKFSDFSEKQKY